MKKNKKAMVKYKNNIDTLLPQICKGLSKDPLSSILPAVKKIVVLGDIHGDWESLMDVLELSKVIKRTNPNIWIGGETVIVQVGDQIDNNRDVGNIDSNQDEAYDIKILKYMTELHNIASKDGGAVYSLLGNHEIMNVMGDFRYVSKKNMDIFENHKKSDGKIIKNAKTARKWAFSNGNDLANFLGCTRYGILMIGSNIFVHGGLIPDLFESYTMDDINNIIRLWLFGETVDEKDVLKVIKSAEYSPLWNRLLGQLPPGEKMNSEYCKKIVEPILNVTEAGKIIIGHTIQHFQNNDGINSTCGNTVVRTDIGMGNGFNNYDLKFKENGQKSDNRKPQVVEILNDVHLKILK